MCNNNEYIIHISLFVTSALSTHQLISMSNKKEWLYPVPGMHEYKGVLCMPDSTIDILHWMEHEVEFEEGDVLLCLYPCSGGMSYYLR